MRRRPIGIWLATVLLMGGVLLLSAALTGLMAAIGMHFGLVRGQPILGIIAFLVISASISMLLSAVFSRRFLRPLLALMKATQEVAAGNFDVRVEGRGHGELGELIEHFNLMARQLSRTEVLRADFVNNISHEIRTPVAAIENCATVLQSGTLTEAEQREYADMIAQNARRLSTLSRNVLDLSRLENQQIVTERRRFRLDEQVRQALVMLEPQWNAKGLELDIELAEADCEGNSGLLMQVWVNLLDNAIKFSPPGGRLAVRLVRQGGELRVSVADQGPGMDHDVTGRIFEKFYQGDPSRAQQGAGLGLALAKRIVDLSRGRIAVDTAPGRGSTFTVCLPARDI